MMFCLKCSKEMSESAKVCPECGHPNSHIVGDSPKSKICAALLCLFLGALGAHRFYVGKIGTAILQLFTFGGCGVWVLIDFIIILVGNFKDKDGYTLR